MKKIIVALVLVASLAFTANTKATWYDWFWKPKKEISVETKNQGAPKPNMNQAVLKESNITSDTQKPNTDIESLKAEIATLKASLDNLYKAHNDLVAAYNKLSKNNLSMDVNQTQKITNLDSKLSEVCDWIFHESLPGCPITRMGSQNLDDRIQKLERGY